MSLSEISVAKDLVPKVLKVAWMTLFLSLSSCKQREGAIAGLQRREAGAGRPTAMLQVLDSCSLPTALGTRHRDQRGLPVP